MTDDYSYEVYSSLSINAWPIGKWWYGMRGDLLGWHYTAYD